MLITPQWDRNPVFPRIGFLETVEASRSHPHYLSDFGGPNRGRGVAAGFWFNGSGPSSVIVNANADGTVSLIEGSPDIGGTRVAVAMHVAEVLGIPIADVHPSIGDTDSIGFTSMTGGSSVAFKTGWACFEAAQDVKSQMSFLAAGAFAVAGWQFLSDLACVISEHPGACWTSVDNALSGAGQ